MSEGMLVVFNGSTVIDGQTYRYSPIRIGAWFDSVEEYRELVGLLNVTGDARKSVTKPVVAEFAGKVRGVSSRAGRGYRSGS